MIDDLAPLLSTLPEPVAPSSMTATVMARIEREAVERTSRVPVRHKRDVSMWVSATLGIALVVGAVAMGWYTNGVPDAFSPRFLRGGLDAAFAGWQATVVGVAGVALCLRALFAPLRAR